MISLRLMFLVLTCVPVVEVSAAPTEPQWTRFRGPNGSGVDETANIPVTWTERDYRWKVGLSGTGFSSPVVWKDRLYLTSSIEEEKTLFVLCLDTTDGRLVWQQRLATKPHPKFKSNGDASATPAVDRDRVYVVWATPDEHVAVAFDRHSGAELWRRDFGPFVAEDGFGASPILVDDVVLITNDQDAGGKSSIVALERTSGRPRWQIDRDSKKAIFSTPCLFEPEGGRRQIIVLSHAHGISSLDPATGARNWELPDVFELRTTGSPLIAGGIIFATNGGGNAGKYLVAARAGIPEQGVRPEVLYQVREAVPYVITHVARWPLVFLWSDRGIVTCLDGPTGKVHWRERVGGDYLGSPVRVRDRIYCMSKKGEMVVLAAQDKFQVLARIDLGEPSYSTPAIAEGVIYLRTMSHLMALEGANR